MREPSFWWREPGIWSALLAPIAALYGAIAALRLRFAGRSAGVPVICIGNLTVGGAGKTPTALMVGRLLADAGQRVFFLSRGYGGELAGPVRVDPIRHRASDVGDEPLLLARIAPTIVSRDRVAGAELARTAGATVIVMDDGFQNPSVHKDIAIIVIDGSRGIGNGRVIPAGPMRAPLNAQLGRTHALLVIGEPSASAAAVITAAAEQHIPVLRAMLEAEADAVASLAGNQVLAFAGIGNPEKFFATLAEAGIPAPVTRTYPDHYRYSALDADELVTEAANKNLLLVTTEKDLARIAGAAGLAALSKAVRALPVMLQLDEPETLRELVLRRKP